jgi:hypothetical protein
MPSTGTHGDYHKASEIAGSRGHLLNNARDVPDVRGDRAPTNFRRRSPFMATPSEGLAAIVSEGEHSVRVVTAWSEVDHVDGGTGAEVSH